VTIDVRVVGAHQLYELNRRLQEAGDKKLAARLRKGIRDGAQPAVAATKAAVLAIPVTNSKGGGRRQRERARAVRLADAALARVKDEDELTTDDIIAINERARARARRGSGLRQTIAGALRLVIKTGVKTAAVRIEVNESKLPPDQRTLPRHLDSPRGWRHPTFGHDPWTHQQGKPWFATTIRKHVGEVRTAVIKAMDEIADYIERGA